MHNKVTHIPREDIVCLNTQENGLFIYHMCSPQPQCQAVCTRTTPAPTKHLLPPQQTQSQTQTKALDENFS